MVTLGLRPGSMLKHASIRGNYGLVTTVGDHSAARTASVLLTVTVTRKVSIAVLFMVAVMLIAVLIRVNAFLRCCQHRRSVSPTVTSSSQAKL